LSPQELSNFYLTTMTMTRIYVTKGGFALGKLLGLNFLREREGGD